MYNIGPMQNTLSCAYLIFLLRCSVSPICSDLTNLSLRRVYSNPRSPHSFLRAAPPHSTPRPIVQLKHGSETRTPPLPPAPYPHLHRTGGHLTRPASAVSPRAQPAPAQLPPNGRSAQGKASKQTHIAPACILFDAQLGCLSGRGSREDGRMGMGKFIYVCGGRRGLKTGTITRHGVDGRVKVRLLRMMVLKMLKMCVV